MADFLFLDPGADVTRRDIYRRGRELGMRVVLVSRALGWEAGQVDDWIEADPTDPGSVLAALAGRRPPAGVVNCSESCLPAAAALAGRYHLPGLRPRIARRCRDKATMGRRLTCAGLPMARRRIVVGAAAAVTAARQIGPPVVLKPSTGVASLFTVRIDTVGEMACRVAQFDAMLATRPLAPLRQMAGRWLVEEFLAGPAFSVESVVSGETVRHVAICEKGPISGPYFREIGHCSPPHLDAASQDMLAGLTERAIRAMGIDHCVTHTEFKWTAAGPRLLEIGARMGGGSIRQVVALATGIDLIEITLELAAGGSPRLRPAPGPAAASRSLYPPRPGTVGRVDTDELSRRPGITAVNRWLDEGAVYRVPPDGYGEVLGVVATAAQVDDAISIADAAIEFAAERIELLP